MKRNQTNKRPSHAVYAVEGEGESSFWTKVGTVWPHDDGDGFSMVLSCLPLTGRLVIRKPKPQAEREAGR